MDNSASVALRPPADRYARRLLLLRDDEPATSVRDAHAAFSRSIAISATRCLLSYVLLPLLAPVAGLSGTTGPLLGLLLGTVSTVAIFFATRRFFAAEHRWRWAYAGVGATIVSLLAVQAVVDVSNLL